MENSKNEDAQPCVILILPNELLIEIIKYLNGCGQVAFSQTCTRLSNVCQGYGHGIR